MAINGLHGLLYTSEPEKLRAMLRDVFRFKSVDAGGGWLIFGLPPAELGVHPLEGENFEAGYRHLCRSCATTSTRPSPNCAPKA
jgi:hypothetical protein